MNTHKDERWLDGELRRVINTSKPEFDAEAWKRSHAEAYEAVTSRGPERRSVRLRANRSVRFFAGVLAAAAMIAVAATVLLMQRSPRYRGEVPPDLPARVSSPADIVSMISLRTAYRQGGEEALNEQLDAALKTLGPRPSGLSALTILSDLES
jgi:hypothetical protein